jgi:hypothetical protein
MMQMRAYFHSMPRAHIRQAPAGRGIGKDAVRAQKAYRQVKFLKQGRQARKRGYIAHGGR